MQVPEGVHSSTMYLNDTRLTQMQRPGRQTCHPKPCRLKSDEPIQRVQPTPLLAGDVDRQQGNLGVNKVSLVAKPKCSRQYAGAVPATST